MDLTIFAGKGGVGKSTAAAAYALHCAGKEKTLLIDYDQGHSSCRVLGLDTFKPKSNTLAETGISNVSLSIINPLSFKTIMQSKRDGEDIDTYFAQFSADQGLVSWCDMMNEFFGVPTDPSGVSQFLYIPEILSQAKEQQYAHLVMDVEPTAGLERMLSHAHSTTRSLRNLNNAGIVMITVIGAKWPDIGAFLSGDYIEKADFYAPRLEQTVKQLKEAKYFLVTTPEASPVQQMGEVEQIINRYDGKVRGYIANNVRGENHEHQPLASLKSKGKLLSIAHDERLCSEFSSNRQEALRQIGQSFDLFE